MLRTIQRWALRGLWWAVTPVVWALVRLGMAWVAVMGRVDHPSSRDVELRAQGRLGRDESDPQYGVAADYDAVFASRQRRRGVRSQEAHPTVGHPALFPPGIPRVWSALERVVTCPRCGVRLPEEGVHTCSWTVTSCHKWLDKRLEPLRRFGGVSEIRALDEDLTYGPARLVAELANARNVYRIVVHIYAQGKRDMPYLGCMVSSSSPDLRGSLDLLHDGDMTDETFHAILADIVAFEARAS